jgi:ubiquinone biosynthesis protein COQ4
VALARKVPGIRQRSLRDALHALYVLIRDPTDTTQGFRLLEALDPLIHHRELESMRREPSGEKLLREQPELLDALCDRNALESLPEGSLGRVYRDFCVREGVEPEGFVEVGEAGSVTIEDALVRYAAHRSRDSHDVWHVVCGYRTDLAGESAILGFILAQHRSPGLLLLLIGAVLHSFAVGGAAGKTMRRLAKFGWKMGRQARPLAAAPWEEWLAKPLDEVRAELRILEVPTYEPAYFRRGAKAVQETRTAAVLDR